MNREIQEAISELNGSIDDFIGNRGMVAPEAMNATKAMPLSENLHGDSHMKSDFGDYIRRGVDNFLTKSMSDGSGESGGHLAPQEIALQVNEKLKFLSPMRRISHIVTISTNSIDMLVDSKLPEAGWAAASENEREETDAPEIKKIKIPVHEIFAKPKANQRLLDDSQINVEEWLMTKVAEKIAALENDAFVNGDGDNKPSGFLNCESAEGEKRDFGKLQHFYTGAAGSLGANGDAVNTLIDMVCSLRPFYVRNAKWVMSRSALAGIRKLKNKEGMCLWQPSLMESSPSTLLGYPVVLDDDMPAVADDSTSVAFGDFYSGYQIVDRQGLKILRDPYTSKPFVEFYVTKRTGGNVVDFDAIKLLKFASKPE
ncbi:MAG: phage major capsid protein [Holosporaceae bacterium]|jgi:HK97 family phage major capsid protein|nr:phage major capsid protein [Holosporaceae bacterium]